MPESTDRELLQEAHDAVIGMRKDIQSIIEKQADHEKRLRFVEKYAAILLGVSIAFQVFSNFYKGH